MSNSVLQPHLVALRAALDRVPSAERSDSSRLATDPAIRFAVARLCRAARAAGVHPEHVIYDAKRLNPEAMTQVVTLIVGMYFFPDSAPFAVEVRQAPIAS